MTLNETVKVTFGNISVIVPEHGQIIFHPDNRTVDVNAVTYVLAPGCFEVAPPHDSHPCYRCVNYTHVDLLPCAIQPLLCLTEAECPDFERTTAKDTKILKLLDTHFEVIDPYVALYS